MGTGSGAGLSRMSPIRRSAKWAGREGKLTTRLVKGARGDVVAPSLMAETPGEQKSGEIALVQEFPCHERKALCLGRLREWRYLWREMDLSQAWDEKRWMFSFRRSRWSLELHFQALDLC
jgi:hypothetical protein